nr:hypothetical protein BaRGS_026072 [Batillaria attramentaria]
MRFNHRELALLAQQTSNVDKEGVLYMKEKQDSIFKKAEGGYRVKTTYLSITVCEGEDNPFKFAAATEEERDGWIQALHMASYECLKMQLQSLREQLQARTGRDPVALPDSSSCGLDLDLQTESATEDPVLEISLSCNDLPNDSQGNMPNSLVLVHIIVPQQQQLWVHHNHTEIAEKNNNPVFLKTIGFGDSEGVDTSTRVRLTVYNVKERMTGTMAQLGQAIFTLQDVLMAPDMSLTLSLQSHDVRSNGKVTIMAWVNESKVSMEELQEAAALQQQTVQPAVPRKSRTLSLGRMRDTLSLHFDNIIKRSFRFATNKESVSLQVHEYMAEFHHCFNIPVQLLRIWIDEEKQKNSLLQDLGELSADSSRLCQEMGGSCQHMITLYTQRLTQLDRHTGPSFKRSVDKDKPDLEFIPVNLHLQRVAVFTESHSAGQVYDTVTAGAAAGFTKKFKNGGLRRVLQQQRTAHTAESTLGSRTKLQRACSLRNEVTDLRQVINTQCTQLLEASETGSLQQLQAVMKELAEQARELVRLCEDSVLCDAADGYLQAKRQASTDGQEETASLRSIHQQSPDKNRRWSGSNLVKSPTTEPWEVTRLNLEAAVVCLMSMVNGLTSHDQPADPQLWSQELGDGVVKLQHFVDVVSAKVSLFLTFLTMMENKDQIQKMHEIKYRRDIVNSHMITTMVASVCALVESPELMANGLLHRLCHCGLLVQAEGLLSCAGDELGMLEDMSVAVEDLNFVKLQFVPTDSDDQALDPTVTMGSHIKEGLYPDFSRHTLCVQIPVQPEVFQRLPAELQSGKLVKVCPVFFNIGINEEATYAEKFGSTALQDRINAESYGNLCTYYEEVNKLGQDTVEKAGGPGTVSHLMKMLHTNVMTKKSKNVEVLHLAAEICRKLGGLRLTACKSGKDRTSMSVTLEMIQNLQRHHNLAPHVFWQALDCVRSVGCRRENTYKNTGVRKYAFNRFQMLYIPKLYRAPGGTYGNIMT